MSRITDELDKIASEIQKEDPRIALAIDLITDKISFRFSDDAKGLLDFLKSVLEKAFPNKMERNRAQQEIEKRIEKLETFFSSSNG